MKYNFKRFLISFKIILLKNQCICTVLILVQIKKKFFET